jgi:hypothetical protein
MHRMHNVNGVYLFVVTIDVSTCCHYECHYFFLKHKSKFCNFSQLELLTLVMDINNYHPELLSRPGERRRYSDLQHACRQGV